MEESVQWWAYDIAYGNLIWDPQTKYIMACGLKSLYELSTARSRDERVEVLQGSKVSEPNRLLSYGQICREFSWSEGQYMSTLRDTSVPPSQPIAIVSVRTEPFYNDPDPGPLKAWRWALNRHTLAGGATLDELDCQLDWGYVLWDEVFLQSAGLFDLTDDEMLLAQNNRSDEECLGSVGCQRRYEIWSQGGLGWWGYPDDESQVIWPSSPEARSYQKADDQDELWRYYDMLRGERGRKINLGN